MFPCKVRDEQTGKSKEGERIVSYYTEKGLNELRDKLAQLKDVERPRASQAIAEARDKGDLSENAEYDAAKEAQGMLELEISKLEETLSNARIIDESKLDSSKVLVHSIVKIKNKLPILIPYYRGMRYSTLKSILHFTSSLLPSVAGHRTFAKNLSYSSQTHKQTNKK